jgi:hypothetical protein
MKAMGGTVGMKGSYNTKDHNKPGIDFGYNLQEIDIQSLTKSFLTIGKLAPVAKYAQGKISSNLDMKASLTKSLEPIYSSLTGGGDLFTNMVTIQGFEPLKKLSDEVKIPKLASQTIKDLKARFSFANGKVAVKPFNVLLSGIDTKIEGTTSFNQEVDYKMVMNIPKEMIPAGMMKLAEQGLSKVNGALPALNIASIPAVIPVKALVGGTVTKPKITTDFKEAILKATGNLKNNIKETVKDTVKAIINDKVNEVKSDLLERKQKLLDDAQKQADRLKAEAAKAAAATRVEGDKQAEALMTQAGSNPLKKKAAEVAGNKVKQEANEKAARIEAEAAKRADALMTDAKAKADKLQ